MSTIRSRTSTNRRMQCTVRGCSKPRAGVGYVCSLHLIRQSHFGDARQQRISRAVVQPYMKSARKYIETFHDNAVIQAALQEVKRLVLSPGEEPPSRALPLTHNARYQAWQECRRLSRPSWRTVSKGRVVRRVQVPAVSPEEALAALIGVWSAVAFGSATLVDDGRCLTFALVDRLLSLREYDKWKEGSSSRTPGALVRWELGRHIRSCLSSFLQNATEAVEGWERYLAAKKTDEHVSLHDPDLPGRKWSTVESKAFKAAACTDRAPRVQDDSPVVIPPMPRHRAKGERQLDRYEWLQTITLSSGFTRNKPRVAYKDHETGQEILDATTEEIARAVTVTG